MGDVDWEDDWDDAPSCGHDDYDVDWEGRATCAYCQESWGLSTSELIAYQEAEARWQAEYNRARRREQSWFWRAIGWFRAMPLTLRRRDDSEVPF